MSEQEAVTQEPNEGGGTRTEGAPQGEPPQPPAPEEESPAAGEREDEA